MSWLFSQALVEEYSEDICSDGELSVQSSGSPTQLAYCALDKMTKFSRLSRFGMTFKPLTASHGEELLMSFLEDFRARTSVLPEKEQESRENEAECGEKWHALLGKYDRNTRSWKTAQCSLFEDLELCLETWPRWGLMRNGECWERQTLAQTIKETEFGLWLTPTVMDGLPPRNPKALERQYQKNRKGRTTHSTLREQVVYPPSKEMFQTPDANCEKWATPTVCGNYNQKGMSKTSGDGLATQVKKWPTPIASRGGAWRSDGQVSMVAKNVATYEEYLLLTQGTSKKKREKYWPTPQASDNRDRGNMSNPSIQRRIEIGKQIMLSQSVDQTSGQLNPDWVEWLMNWPIKWSNLNEFNKQEFQRWQKASAKAIQDIGQMRTMWWDSDPSQTPLGQQPFEQSTEQHCDSLPEMPRVTSCERKMERSQQGSNLSLLREDVYIQEVERKNLQSGMREQTGLDKTEIIPRVSQSIVARVDRLKAIGNGQVPLCAATAWRILTEPDNDDK